MKKDAWFFINMVLNAIAIMAFMILLFMCLIFATGCNTEKKATKKDNAAIERVTGKRSLLDKIAPVIQGIYPCANDTVFKTNRDTLIMYDTASVLVASTDTINKVRVDTLIKKVVVTKIVTVKDSAFIIDNQKSNIDAKTIQSQALTVATLNQNIIDLNLIIKQKSTKITWLIIACILGGIVILGLAYLLFKPSVKL